MSKRRPTKKRVETQTRRWSETRERGARPFDDRQRQSLRGRGPRRQADSMPSLFIRARGTLGRLPRAAWVCAIVAFVNAACWSILMPPFQFPDEPDQFAYTQQLAENTRLPSSNETSYSQEERIVLQDIHQYAVRQSPETKTISSDAEQRHLQEDLNGPLSRKGGGGVGGAYATPPLYALLEIVPYGLASGGSLLDQLEAMRLISALFAGLTALFVFMFLRETLPGVPWAWTVGGVSVALAPLLGFTSGAVSPDSMLVAVSAAIFYGLARAFRRGLTRRLAIAIGAATAVGFLTKLNFVGLAPGIVLGLIALTVRASRTYGRAAYFSLGLALAIATLPIWLYTLVNLISNQPTLGPISSELGGRALHGSILTKISYIWQFYLPRLPGMTNDFPGLSTTRRMWFDRGVGYYGWIDTWFPLWVDNAALLIAGAIALLWGRALVVARAALRLRIVEIAVYGAMVLGLMTLIGITSYLNWATEGILIYPKYLLPLLPLFGVGLAVAARGAGQRYGPAVGASIVVVFLAHDIFSQLLIVGRYYA